VIAHRARKVENDANPSTFQRAPSFWRKNGRWGAGRDFPFLFRSSIAAILPDGPTTGGNRRQMTASASRPHRPTIWRTRSLSLIVAKRLVKHLERSGIVVMKKPPIGGSAALGRGH
jgi:hypothetical protein